MSVSKSTVIKTMRRLHGFLIWQINVSTGEKTNVGIVRDELEATAYKRVMEHWLDKQILIYFERLPILEVPKPKRRRK